MIILGAGIAAFAVMIYLFEKDKRWLWYQIIELRNNTLGSNPNWFKQPNQTVVQGILNHIGDSPRHILLLKLDHIGDIVLTLPTLKALRRQFKTAHITLACGSWGVDMLKAEGVVDEFITINYLAPNHPNPKAELATFYAAVAGKQFDIAVDLRPFGNTQFLLKKVSAQFKLGSWSDQSSTTLLHFTDVAPQDIHVAEKIYRMAQHLGCTAPIEGPQITFSSDETAFADQFFESTQWGNATVIGIHAFANVETRNWGVDNFAAVATQLVALGYKVIWFAVKQPNTFETLFSEEIKKNIVVVSQAQLRESMAIMSRCTVFVSNNSGPMHMAAASGCPTLGVFSGAEIPLEWGPYGMRNRSIIADIGCIRCHQSHCAHKSCLTSISPSNVLMEIRSMVESRTVSNELPQASTQSAG
ncbi:glycosyltransferase family 9 protein [bacterium]|nr:glycosyltransferase family 9 protein [bacterium]